MNARLDRARTRLRATLAALLMIALRRTLEDGRVLVLTRNQHRLAWLLGGNGSQADGSWQWTVGVCRRRPK